MLFSFRHALLFNTYTPCLGNSQLNVSYEYSALDRMRSMNLISIVKKVIVFLLGTSFTNGTLFHNY